MAVHVARHRDVFCCSLQLALAMVVMLTATRGAADPIKSLEQHQVELFERVSPAVVLLAGNMGFGSGFFVNSKGLILTNRHVVGDAKQVQVVLTSGKNVEGRVIERSEDADLALVQVDLTRTQFLKLVTDTLKIGSWVASVGHGSGTIWTFNTGMVSNLHATKEGQPVFQTQIPLNPGNSGGPIVNRHGEVVGILTAGITESNSINFGIKTEMALRSLRGLAQVCDCVAITTPQKHPIFLDGEMVGTGPRVVIPITRGAHEVFAVIDGKQYKKRFRFPAVRELRLGSVRR